MKKLGIISLIILLLASAAGCAQRTPGQEEPVIGVIDQQNMPVLTQDSGPAKGGRLSLFMTTPDTLDPLYSQNPYVRYLSQFMYDSLFKVSDENKAENGLAESWQISADGLMLDIQLHDGVMFHDGTSLSSSDVAYTIKAIQKAKDRGIYYGNIENVDSTVTPDRLHIRLIMKKADPDILSKLTFPVLPEHVFKDWPIEGYDIKQKPIGSGAFRFDYMNETLISLSRNENWWYAYAQDGLKHSVWMDGIDFRIYGDEKEMMPAFQRQEVDIAVVDGENLESYSNRTDILYNNYSGNQYEYVLLSTLGTEGSRMANPEVRASLLKYIGWYMALDPLASGVPASQEYAEYGAEGSRVDKDNTLKALTGLGMIYDENRNILYYYKNGSKIPFTLEIKYNSMDPDRLASAEWLQKALDDIGIDVVLKPSNGVEEQSLVSSRKFDIMLLGSRIPLYSNLNENIGLISESLGFGNDEAVLIPLYRKSQAVLYSPKIKGPRLPFWKNVFNGWTEWYLVSAQTSSNK